MKYRIAAVSYVNTLPFLYGLQLPEVQELVDVVLAHPARCAELLQKGEVDIALCPIGALPALNQYRIITDYCIGCDGPVRTVSIYSNQPLSELTHIVLSSESRTSNLLVQMINREHWKYNIEFIPVLPVSPISPGFLCIGDICFQKEKEFRYRTDLGQAWKEWTGLPFTFACWVSREDINNSLIDALNNAFKEGIRNIDTLTFPDGLDPIVLRKYLKTNISFEFDGEKKKAMERFLELTPGPSLTKRGE